MPAKTAAAVETAAETAAEMAEEAGSLPPKYRMTNDVAAKSKDSVTSVESQATWRRNATAGPRLLEVPRRAGLAQIL